MYGVEGVSLLPINITTWYSYEFTIGINRLSSVATGGIQCKRAPSLIPVTSSSRESAGKAVGMDYK